ncbi:MAG: mechanosensitive ion channel [Solobacterium sp.]|nr:mechanosensitive ion channel [Solobacterium sp.]
MKQKKSIILLAISILLILLLANPGILPLSPATKETLKELEKSFMLIQGSGKITLAHILTVLLAVLAVYACYTIIRLILEYIGAHSPHSRTVTTLFAGLLKYIAWIIAVVWGLTILGVQTGTVLAGIGILGLILGFGAQSLIEDIITGFFIIFEGQYAIGDIIILDDFRGVVRSINVRTTVIEDAGGNLKIVNNSDIRNLQNRSRNVSKAICLVSVSYDTDVPHLEAVLKEGLQKMYKEHPKLYLAEPEYLGIEELADSGVNLKITADVREEDIFRAKRQLNRDVFVLFKEKGIEIPFPQVDVHQKD